jgi:hypothetical protein
MRAAGANGGLRSLLRRLGGWARPGSGTRLVETGAWELPRDSTLGLRPGHGGVAVRCREGTLLVTQAADPLDHVLTPGDEVKLGRRGRVAIWALSDAALTTSGG